MSYQSIDATTLNLGIRCVLKEHHLFPTMPQFKQRLVQPRVKALAEKHGLPYHCLSYTDAIKATLNNLDKVAMDLMGKDH